MEKYKKVSLIVVSRDNDQEHNGVHLSRDNILLLLWFTDLFGTTQVPPLSVCNHRSLVCSGTLSLTYSGKGHDSSTRKVKLSPHEIDVLWYLRCPVKLFFFFHLNEMNELFYLAFIPPLLFALLVDFNNESYFHIWIGSS